MTSSYRRVAHILGAAAALAMPVAPALAQSFYAITLLNGLDGASSNIASAINSAGAIVGTTTTFNSTTQLYTRSAWFLSPGSNVPLGLAPPSGYSANWLSDVNSNGVVAGYSYNLMDGSGNSVFTWLPGTSPQALATPATAHSSVVSKINDAGNAVGYIEHTPLVYSAVAWDTSGHASALATTPMGPATFANAINNSGQMLVTGSDGKASRDYLWDEQTGYTGLANAQGFSQHQGIALNDVGHGVGFASDDRFSLAGHATFWADPWHVFDLGTLPGDAHSLAFSVNASDMVVGISGDVLYGDRTRGFLWSAGTGMVDVLSLLEPHDPLVGHIGSVQAYDINDAGQIVGSLVLDGVQRAFVMTPVPEPAPWMLLLAGVGGIAGFRGRERLR